MLQHDIVLECQNVSHSIGNNQILYDINLKIIRGEIVALVGKTGAGKSTLLRAILGTHLSREGKVIVTNSLGEQCIVQKPGRDRGIVYQHYSLFPFLTAQQNVALGLMLDQTSIPWRLFCLRKWCKLRKQHLEQAAEILKKVQLDEKDMKKYPSELSGGMRQRAAIAQALVMEPEILLLDEPFGAVDEATREELQKMLLGLYDENCRAKNRNEPPTATILIVTHELNEAIYVGDRVIALSQYWNWREDFEECPGATIVYDEMTPVNLPDQERDFEKFTKQRKAIRAAAFDEYSLHRPEDFLNFWRDVSNGIGTGVIDPNCECDKEYGLCPLRGICDLIKEMGQIKRSAKSTGQQKHVRSKLSKLWQTAQEKDGLFDDVFGATPHATERLQQIRKAADQDCFKYQVRKAMSYLGKYAPQAQKELSDRLSPIWDIIESGESKGQNHDNQRVT